MGLRRENVTHGRQAGRDLLGMFAFGYALVPLYKAICE